MLRWRLRDACSKEVEPRITERKGGDADSAIETRLTLTRRKEVILLCVLREVHSHSRRDKGRYLHFAVKP